MFQKQRAHAFSLKKENENWHYRDVDELSASIKATRLNEDDYSYRAYEDETKDCDDCGERRATVKGNQKVAHCTGDVFGSYWLLEGNTNIIDYNHQVEFDCCN